MPGTDPLATSDTIGAFRATLGQEAPPREWTPPLAALWHLEKGDRERAHGLVQEDVTPEGAWVHALIHRIEGDLWNARYWYRRANQPEGQGDPRLEHRAILERLLT